MGKGYPNPRAWTGARGYRGSLPYCSYGPWQDTAEKPAVGTEDAMYGNSRGGLGLPWHAGEDM